MSALFGAFCRPKLQALLQALKLDRAYVSGTGDYLTDIEGRTVVDFVGGFGTTVLGHNHPAITHGRDREGSPCTEVGLHYQHKGECEMARRCHTVGVVVDDTSHFIMRFECHRKRGTAVDEAVRRTRHTVGHSIVSTSFILVGAFITLSASSFLPIAHFGIFIALCVTLALYLDIFCCSTFCIEGQAATAWGRSGTFRNHRRRGLLEVFMAEPSIVPFAALLALD